MSSTALKKSRWFGSWTHALARSIPDVLAYKTDRDLQRCGFYAPDALENYLAIRNLCTFGAILASASWVVALSDEPALQANAVIAGLVFTIFAYALPRIYLSWMGDRRANAISAGLPDALNLMSMGISGGLSMTQALGRVMEQLAPLHPALAKELAIVQLQSSSHSSEYAWSRFSERLDVEELSALSEAIQYGMDKGVPLVRTLQNFADQITTARAQKVQRLGNTVALQMLFPTILCLAPAAFILILMPPLIELRTFRDRESKAGGVLSRDTLQGNARQSPARNPPRRP
jgi:tight adherence protein C